VRKTGCGKAGGQKSALWGAQTAARVEKSVLQAGLGCGRKRWRCAIGCSACWQNVDGGLAARHGKRERPLALAVTCRGQCSRRAASHAAPPVAIASSIRRLRRLSWRAAHQERCIQTTRSTWLASERWATAWESGKRIPPVECHQDATPRAQHRLASNTKHVSRCLDAVAGSICCFSAPPALYSTPCRHTPRTIGFARILPTYVPMYPGIRSAKCLTHRRLTSHAARLCRELPTACSVRIV
jgi:hypothetical protein